PAGLLAAATGVLLLSACGSENAPAGPANQQGTAASSTAPPAGPAPVPAAKPAAPGTECGPVNTAGGAKAKVVVREGAVDCPQAVYLERRLPDCARVNLLRPHFRKVFFAELALGSGAGFTET